MLTVHIMKCGDIPGTIPAYATEGSAGMDITAALLEPMFIEPGAIVLIPTGIAIALPQGFECQVRSRSGLAAKHGIFALNAPGTIDSDYRGEIKVILANSGKASADFFKSLRVSLPVRGATSKPAKAPIVAPSITPPINIPERLLDILRHFNSL